MVQTAYNFGKIIPAEKVAGKSITQPEQVMPLRKIIDGLRNGTLVLDMSKTQKFDIPEHDIDVPLGRTPESTNAAIHDASLADLSAKADAAGDDITAAPGFTIEDCADLVDRVETCVAASMAARKPEAGEPGAAKAGAASQKASDGQGGDRRAPSEGGTPPSAAANEE